MHKVELTEMQMHTIIAALDDIRSDNLEAAHIADVSGDETPAKIHYDTAQEYETLILSLQAQMKGN